MAEDRDLLLTLTFHMFLKLICLLGSPTYFDFFSFNLYVSLGFNLFRACNLRSWDVIAQSRIKITISFRNKFCWPLHCSLRYLQVFMMNTQSTYGNKGHPEAQGPCHYHYIIQLSSSEKWESPESGDQVPQ